MQQLRFTVRMPEREGQQMGVVTKPLTNNVPLSITIDLSFFIGVRPPKACMRVLQGKG